MKDPSFLQVYNPKLLKKLAKRYGPTLYHHVDISVSSQVMRDMLEHMLRKKPRRGEVVMVIPNRHGQVWLHTKDFYPRGVYRLMSGGLESKEKPHQALIREAKEETGFEVEIERCLAVITYKLIIREAKLWFVTYVFSTTPEKGLPKPLDKSEPITDFQAVTLEELRETAAHLRRLEGDFADWGKFRAIAHELAAKALSLDKVG